MDVLGISKEDQFCMLATAIAGRPIEVIPSSDELSWCDGERIHLAAGDGSYTVVVQAALVAAGSLAAEELLSLVGRLRLQRRYLILEVGRALQTICDIAPPAVIQAIASLHITEVSVSPKESLAKARGREVLPEVANWLGTIKPASVLTRSARLKQRGALQSSSGIKRSPVELDKNTETTENNALQGSKNDAAGMGNPLANLLRRILGSSGSSNSDSLGGAEIAGLASLRPSPRLDTTAHAHREIRKGSELILAPTVTDHTYPEWDSRRRAYRQCWTTVREPSMSVPKSTIPLEVSEDPRLRRALSGLGLAHERHRRQAEGDSLDLSALIDYAVNRMAGTEVDSRVYEIRRRTAHDLSALVLLDTSGSTADGDQRLSVFEAQCQVAARLMAVLDELGDRVAGYAFRAWGRHNVQLLQLKSFDDRFNIATRRRLAALSPAGFTRIGAAIRHSSHVLASRGGTANRLLVVVSDGLPYDDSYEGVYAQEDVRKALAEAVDMGIGCACVTLGDGTNNTVLSRAWGAVPYIRLASAEELHKVVLPIFRGGLRQAAAMGRDGRQNGDIIGDNAA